MKTNLSIHPLVKKTIDALQSGNPDEWLPLFAEHAEFYEEGKLADLRDFFGKAIGQQSFVLIDGIQNYGLNVYGIFHGNKSEDFKTYFKFQLNDSEKITRLEINKTGK